MNTFVGIALIAVCAVIIIALSWIGAGWRQMTETEGTGLDDHNPVKDHWQGMEDYK